MGIAIVGCFVFGAIVALIISDKIIISLRGEMEPGVARGCLTGFSWIILRYTLVPIITFAIGGILATLIDFIVGLFK